MRRVPFASKIYSDQRGRLDEARSSVEGSRSEYQVLRNCGHGFPLGPFELLRQSEVKRYSMIGEIFGVDGVIVAIVLVVLLFGGAAIPKLARNLGSAKNEFEKGLQPGKREALTATPNGSVSTLPSSGPPSQSGAEGSAGASPPLAS
jgi:Sec-independent protein translocase protein TatA